MRLSGEAAPSPVGRKRDRRETLAAIGFLAPNFLGFFLFVAFPILFSLYLVFTNWSLKPAIETRFLGLGNVWQLLGFRATEHGGGMHWLLAYAGSYLLVLGAIVGALVAYARKAAGVRLCGWIAIALGTVLLMESIVSAANVGWALFGITLVFGGLFFVIDPDAPFGGKGALPALLLATGVLGVRIFHASFAAHWEPLDPLFWKYLYNTIYLMFLIPIQIAGSLALALVLSKPVTRFLPSFLSRVLWLGLFLGLGLAGLFILAAAEQRDAALLWMVFWSIAALGVMFGVTSFRTLFFLPSFTAGVAVMLLWKQMYNPDFGLLNEMLRTVYGYLRLSADPPRWILDPAWAKPALILMGFWMFVGGTNMLIYLAGLANVPEELYEAARIDGASRWQEFQSVTWPQLAPTTFFIVIMSTIAGLQGGFEQARVMTEGGPAGSTKTLAYYIYEKAFQELSLGYASAIAWIMFLLIFLLTALNWKFGTQYVND